MQNPHHFFLSTHLICMIWIWWQSDKHRWSVCLWRTPRNGQNNTNMVALNWKKRAKPKCHSVCGLLRHFSGSTHNRFAYQIGKPTKQKTKKQVLKKQLQIKQGFFFHALFALSWLFLWGLLMVGTPTKFQVKVALGLDFQKGKSFIFKMAASNRNAKLRAVFHGMTSWDFLVGLSIKFQVAKSELLQRLQCYSMTGGLENEPKLAA